LTHYTCLDFPDHYTAYLDEVISEEEYLAQKQKMIDQRVEMKEKIREIEDEGVS
jgi:hypothetical protein